MLTKKRVLADPLWKAAFKNEQLVYAMRQVHDLKVAGMPGTRGAKQFYAQGICHGISLRWIELRKIVKDYEHKHEDGVGICHEVSLRPYNLQLEQSASNGIQQDVRDLDNVTYLGSKNDIDNINGSKILRAAPLLANQYTYFASQGHAMALQKKGSAYHFLDPNWGHFRFTSLGDCQSFMQRIILRSKYKGPYEAHLMN